MGQSVPMQSISDPDGDALADAPLSEQVAGLEQAVLKNPAVNRILERLQRSPLPNWYLGAGAITQTVWNLLHGLPAGEGIKDYDTSTSTQRTSRPPASARSSRASRAW